MSDADSDDASPIEEKRVVYRAEGQVVDVGVTHLVIHDSVKRIPAGAFGLVEPRNLVTVGQEEASVESHDVRAMHSRYSSLTIVELHDDVTIGERAFKQCKSLRSVIIRESETTLTSSHESDKEIVGEAAFARCDVLESVELPGCIKKVDDVAFAYCTSLTNVQFPSGLRIIGHAAFIHCPRMECLHFPQSLQIINGSAFSCCHNLVKLNLSSSLETIGEHAFYNCESIVNICLPSSLQTIGSSAFEGCISLVEIDLPSSLQTIGNSAFKDCKALVEVNIPSSVVEIQDYAFNYCENLMSVKLQSPRTKIGWNAFGKNPQIVATELRRSHPNLGLIACMVQNDLVGLASLDKSKLSRAALQSQLVRKALNRRMSARRPCFFLLLEAYANIAVIMAFIYSSSRFLKHGQSDRAANIWLVVLSFYFMVKEFVQIQNQKGYYLSEGWNLLDISRIILTIWSAISMESISEGKHLLRNPPRKLLMLTGGIVITSGILFLRMAFLPFAKFVGGLTSIFKKLLPFIVVSVLLVFAFAYMYFALGSDETPDECSGVNFTSLGNSMLTSFSFVFGGSSPTSMWFLDLLFGFVVLLVLLNVVIAIVSHAWSESTKKGSLKFWEYRIRFLSEIQKSTRGSGRKSSWNCFKCLFEAIDERFNSTLRDAVPWNEHPYSEARDDFVQYAICRELARYNCTADLSRLSETAREKLRRFSNDDRKKLAAIRSYERDWYWAGQGRLSHAQILCNFLANLALVLLGFPSFGLLWPRRFRKYIFLHEGEPRQPTKMEEEVEAIHRKLIGSMEESDGVDDTIESRLGRIESQQVSSEERLLQLEGKISEVNSKLDEVLELIRNQQQNHL